MSLYLAVVNGPVSECLPELIAIRPLTALDRIIWKISGGGSIGRLASTVTYGDGTIGWSAAIKLRGEVFRELYGTKDAADQICDVVTPLAAPQPWSEEDLV